MEFRNQYKKQAYFGIHYQLSGILRAFTSSDENVCVFYLLTKQFQIFYCIFEVSKTIFQFCKSQMILFNGKWLIHFTYDRRTCTKSISLMFVFHYLAKRAHLLLVIFPFERGAAQRRYGWQSGWM